MPLPKPVKNVPRAKVHKVVKVMLLEKETGNVRCERQKNGKYTIRARPK